MTNRPTYKAPAEHGTMTVLHPAGAFLNGWNADETSQFGENGLIARTLLEMRPERDPWCFECGACDGMTLSNTYPQRVSGWKAVLIEGDPELWTPKATQIGKQSGDLWTWERADRTNIAKLLKAHGFDRPPALGVIDVDGQETWLLRGLFDMEPRLLVIEFGQEHPEAPEPPEGGSGQAGWAATLERLKAHDYVPLAATFCNIIAVKRGELDCE